MALNIKQLPLPRSPQRTSARRLKIAFVVAHHMTIVGTGNGNANELCRVTWRTREASAHYGVDGSQVAQFVPDSQAAWATAKVTGNHAGISIEHANSSRGPQWRISDDTLDTGARLAAELHHKHGLGRPVKNVTLKRHSDFFPTACPGPYFESKWDSYCNAAQNYYDNGTTTNTDGGFLMALSDNEQEELLRKTRNIWDNMPAQKNVKSSSGILAQLTKAAAGGPVNVDEIASAIVAKLGEADTRDLDTTKRAIREVLTEGVSE